MPARVLYSDCEAGGSVRGGVGEDQEEDPEEVDREKDGKDQEEDHK